MVDLYPTLLRLAGVSTDQPKPVDGRDAWPTITRGASSPHDFVLHNVTPFHGAIRMGDWKLVYNGHISANSTTNPEKERWELFDISKDSSEKNDLKAEYPEVLAKLKAKLAELAAAAVEPNIPPNRAPRGFKAPEVWGESTK
jgi:arylsulfatase A-like enzyme